MAIHDEMSWRDMSRVKNPSRATLSDVVNSADVQMAEGGYSPYSSLIDDTGAEQMVKVEELSATAEVPPALPLGTGAVYDELLGLSLTEGEIWAVYEGVKQGYSPNDVAISFNITPTQVSAIYTAILNGGTAAEILNPASAQFRTSVMAASDMLSSSPANLYSVDGNQIMTMGAPTSAPVAEAGVLGGMPAWAIGLGALAIIMLLKDK